MIQERGIEDVFRFFDSSLTFLFFSKLKELYSVLHSKIFIFDDIVILTGANLDDSYMKDRLDRYLVLQSREFSDDLNFLFQQFLEGGSFQYHRTFRNYLKNETQICMYDQSKEYDVLENIAQNRFEEITLATGYLNFPKQYYRLFEHLKMRILTSAPRTSTYTNNRVFERNVVESYLLFAADTQRVLPNASIYEFGAEKLTFHCKGLWAFSSDFACFIVGSSNFNVRSAERDIETNFFILTKDKHIINILKEEHDWLISMCERKSLKELESRNISFFTRLGVYFFRNYL